MVTLYVYTNIEDDFSHSTGQKEKVKFMLYYWYDFPSSKLRDRFILRTNIWTARLFGSIPEILKNFNILI